jgi:hypothetical protein
MPHPGQSPIVAGAVVLLSLLMRENLLREDNPRLIAPSTLRASR